MDLIIDIGGTKIYSALLKKGKIVEEKKEIHKGRKGSLENILSYYSSHYSNINNIAYSIAGHVHDNKIIKSPNFPELNSMDMLLFTRAYLPSASVIVENDANCFTLGESLKRKSSDIVIGVVWGTGIGSGIAINKKLIKGANNISGEIGHFKMGHDLLCGCGKKGCLEAVIGGKYLEKNEKVDIKLLMNKHQDIFLRDTIPWLVSALEKIIHFLYPDVIVFGGSIGEHLTPKFLGYLKEKLQQNLSFSLPFRLEISESTSHAVIDGCKMLIYREIERG